MMVFDISDPEDLRYELVAFKPQKMLFLERLDAWREWKMMGQELRGLREEIKVESDRPRRAISAKAYANKFGVQPVDEVDVLEKLPLVEPVAFKCKLRKSSKAQFNEEPTALIYV
jgi:hypothetical protein